FYETAPRLADSLGEMAAVLGDRPAAIARELTKLHEELRRDRLSALAAHYAAAGPPKGEIVIVVGPPEAEAAAVLDDAALDRRTETAPATPRAGEASAAIAAETGLSRRQVYARALALKSRRSD